MKKILFHIFILLILCELQSESQVKYSDFPDSLKMTFFVEGFDNNINNWTLENNWITASMRDNTYTLINKNYNNNIGISTIPIKFDNNQDWDLEVNLKIISGTGALVIGMDEQYNHFRIELNQNSEVYMVKEEDSKGQIKTYHSYKEKNIIHNSSANKVTIRHTKNKYYLFINQQFVCELKDLQLLGNYFGFSVGVNSQITINDFRLNYLNYNMALSKNVKRGIPDLSISNIEFVDSNHNNVIDENEESLVAFDISNRGKASAEGLRAYVKSIKPTNNITFRNYVEIGEIKPGETKTVNIPFKGASSIETGSEEIKVAFSENMGFPPDTLLLTLAVQKAPQPLIKTVDFEILTLDGSVRLGKPVKVKALIQNVGLGDAQNVRIAFIVPETNIIVQSNDIFSLGNLKAGDTATISFDFIPNKMYKNSTIPITIKPYESTGKFAQSLLIEPPVNGLANSAKVVKMGGETDYSNYQIKVASLNKNSDNSLMKSSNSNDSIKNKNTALLGNSVMKTVPLKTNTVNFTEDFDVDKNIPKSNIERPNRYALIIGNEDYSTFQNTLNTEINVDYAANDAKVFKEYASQIMCIPESHIKLLTNATYAQMNQGISWLTNLAKVENGNAELIFYYSGHGLPDEKTKEPYLIPVDVSGSDLQDGIKLDNVINRLTNVESKRVTMFLDACFSGGARNKSLVAMKGVKIVPKEVKIGGNLVIFSSSSGDESSGVYRSHRHGFFTYYLLKKMQESNGLISYKNMADYLNQTVQRESGLGGKIQTPKIYYSPVVEGEWENWIMK